MTPHDRRHRGRAAELARVPARSPPSRSSSRSRCATRRSSSRAGTATKASSPRSRRTCAMADAVRRGVGQQAAADLLHVRRRSSRPSAPASSPLHLVDDDRRACDAGRASWRSRCGSTGRGGRSSPGCVFAFAHGHADHRGQPRDDRDVHDPADVARRARVRARRAARGAGRARRAYAGGGRAARHRRRLQAGRRLRRRGDRDDDLADARASGARARAAGGGLRAAAGRAGRVLRWRRARSASTGTRWRDRCGLYAELGAGAGAVRAVQRLPAGAAGAGVARAAAAAGRAT